MAKRNIAVDLLRGGSMVLVVFLHSIAPYLDDPVWFYIWDYLHFAVAGFIFCSALILFDRFLSTHPDDLFHLKNLWKRFSRLYLPYAIFVAIFLAIQWWFEPSKVTIEAILQNLLLTGGIDINWLVLLFLQFVILFPAIAWLYMRLRIGFWIYTALAIAISGFLYLAEWPLFVELESWKWIMWIPWSLIGLYAIGHLRSKLIANKAITLPLLIIGTGALLIVQPLVGDTITIFDNKYPPDLLFIGYGITAVTLFYWLFSVQTVQRQPWLTKPLGFFSIYSYPIYFIHYLVLYVAEQYDLSPMMHPLMFFVIVLTVTAAIMAGIARFKIV